MRACAAAFVLMSLFAYSSARAQDAGTPDATAAPEFVQPLSPPATDAETPEGKAPVANAPLLEAPPPPPPAATLPPIAAPPALTSTPEPTDPDFFGPPDVDAWPIELVLRPLTLPAGTWRAGVASSLFLPDTSFRSPSGAAFGRSTTIGLNATFGITNRLQIGLTVPRIICISQTQGDVSGCSSFNRFIGTGGGLDYSLVRTRVFQLALSGALTLALSEPNVVAGDLDIDTKWLLASRLALLTSASVSKWLGAPAYYTSQAIGSGGLSANLNLQLTRHLVVSAGTAATGPLDHLGQPRVAAGGGVSWTFENGVELGASGTTFEVVERRAWDQTIPGTSFGVGLRTWM